MALMDLAGLFGSISADLSATMGGPYWAGQILAGAPGHYDDDTGAWVPGSDADPVTCLIQIDQATEAMRRSDGYTDGDMRCLILASSFAGTLDTDARVAVTAGPYTGSTWLISSIERDPFASYWAGRGRRAST